MSKFKSNYNFYARPPLRTVLGGVIWTGRLLPSSSRNVVWQWPGVRFVVDDNKYDIFYKIHYVTYGTRCPCADGFSTDFHRLTKIFCASTILPTLLHKQGETWEENSIHTVSSSSKILFIWRDLSTREFFDRYFFTKIGPFVFSPDAWSKYKMIWDNDRTGIKKPRRECVQSDWVFCSIILIRVIRISLWTVVVISARARGSRRVEFSWVKRKFKKSNEYFRVRFETVLVVLK